MMPVDLSQPIRTGGNTCPTCRGTHGGHYAFCDAYGKARPVLAPKADTQVKDTNPKDAIGATKLPLNLVPDSLPVYAAMAFAEGASKYGAYNWRVAGVRFSIYMAAMQRHQIKLWNGEDVDPATGVPHLASIMACAGIIADAKLLDKLVDDRPPRANMAELIAEAEAVVAKVVAMHSDRNPHHYTIDDPAVP